MKEGIKNRLKEAYENRQKIQIIFKYPEFTRRTIKSGFVVRVDEDSFDFDELLDGHSTFSYDFITEINEVSPNGSS